MRQESGDASLLRKLNSAAILRILRAGEVVTLTELARAARVSRPTAEGIVEELLAKGWAEECAEEPGDRQRGRPARRFRFHGAAGHVIGVDVGGYKLLSMTSDLNGEILATRRVAVSPEMSAAERIKAIVALVEESVLEEGKLAAVAVGTTGVVDEAGRVVKSVAIPEWTGIALQAELADRIPVPVVVENDMRLAVLAEHWRGAARGYRDVVYLFTGNRIGLGLLIGGLLHRGAHAASGEIGDQSSGYRLAFRNVIDYALSADPGELRSPGESAEFAVVRAREGDEAAARAVEAFASCLADGLVTIVNPLDPELVVVGGGLSQAGSLLVEPIQRHLNRVTLYPPQVVASRLGNESVALGAVRLALDHLDRTLFASMS
ncbi:ROK family transcriptional regulator [Streptosporangium sp. NPDC000396]|uniref:ROK family transcriptional regulator n=1 Tax=Streptosporangium sp. NPDC000396 TaxID=3366185 RepID=UPI0036A06120